MNNILDKTKYFPTLVHDVNKSVNGFEKIRKLHTLPQKTQDLLLSDEIGKFIYGVEQRYHLQDIQTEEFSRTVRKYFFREITEGDFAKKVSILCNISLKEALKLLSVIKVIKLKNGNEENNKDYVKLSFDEAIQKYPKILNQIITQKAIITKPFLKPIKPTVKNWIMVYEKILDVSKHNSIERGEFVFRSQATKGISEEERQKLLILFKSRDEGDKLTIDSRTSKIIFNKIIKTINNNFSQQTKFNQEKKGQIKSKVADDNSQDNISQNKHTLNYIPHSLNKVVDTQIKEIQQNNFENKNNTFQNAKQEQISSQGYLSAEVQKEIAKNKIEMNNVSKNNINTKRENKKIGSTVFDTSKLNNKNTTQQKISVGKSGIITEQKSEKIKTTTGLQKNKLNKKQLINKPKLKITKKTPNTKKGKISFSSNHVMPAEKNKQKQSAQQQTQYNTFNIKPIGQVHNIKKEK